MGTRWSHPLESNEELERDTGLEPVANRGFAAKQRRCTEPSAELERDTGLEPVA